MNTRVIPEKRNYRVLEFANTYGIGRTQAFIEIKNGRLRAFKVGKITLISREAAEAWQSLYEKAK